MALANISRVLLNPSSLKDTVFPDVVIRFIPPDKKPIGHPFGTIPPDK
jgi:hypothetical protein